MTYRIVRRGKKKEYEHRIVMEEHIGRPLKKDDYVHHINGNTLDNRLENLQLMTDKEHGSHHHKRSFSVDRLKELMDSGMTFSQIAKTLKKPYSTVQVAARELGLKYAHSQESRRRKREFACIQCGKVFIRPDLTRRHSFCSFDCYNKYPRKLLRR